MSASSKVNLDSWIHGMKWLKRIAIAASIIVILLIGLYFYSTRGLLSNQQSDWAALGSFLSGVFSFLGALGTIGVLLLGMSQFIELKKQTNEISMINHFEMFIKHKQIFSDYLGYIESKIDNYYSIPNYYSLYKKIFPENSINKLSFQHDEIFIHNLKLDLESLILRFQNNISKELIEELVHFESKMTLGRRDKKNKFILKTKSNAVCIAPLEIAYKLNTLGLLLEMIHEFLDLETWNRPTIDFNKITFLIEDYVVENIDSELLFNVDSLDKLVLKLLNKFKHYLTDGTMESNEALLGIVFSSSGPRFRETVNELQDKSNLFTSVFEYYKNSKIDIPEELNTMYQQALYMKLY
jgi:hypothetical protein